MGWTNWHSDSGKCIDFPILKHVETSSEAHTLKYLLGRSSYCMRLTTHLKLVPLLRMSADIPTIPLYAFMSCTRKTLLLPRAN